MNWNVWTLIHCVPNPLWAAESIAAFWAELPNIWFSKFVMGYKELHFENDLQWFWSRKYVEPCREENFRPLISQMDECRLHTAHRLLPFQQPSLQALSQCSQQRLQKAQVPQSSQKEAENHLILNSGLFCHTAPSCHKENTLANCYIIVGKHWNLLKTFTNETQLLKLNTRCLLQCVALID